VRDLAIDFYGGAHDAPLGLGLSAAASRHGAAGLAAHRERLDAFLAAVLDAPGTTPIGALDLLTPQEHTRLLTEFNATERPYDLSSSLPALIAAQAARTPDSIAVRTEDASLDYAGLLDRADRLAAHLRDRGVRPGDIVGVFDVRSVELVVSLLAVLRAGAAYLPLDPELPQARLRFQLGDAGVRIVLTRSTLADQLAAADPDGRVGTITVDTALAGLPPATLLDPELPDPELTPESPAYVIYTSGSTGTPKGVVVPHRGVVNRLLWMRDDYDIGADDCILQKTSFSFDVSVWEFFLPLITGGRLRLLAPGAQRDPEQVARAVAEGGVTVLHFVPSMLDLFLEEHGPHDLSGIRHVFCSGEALRPQTVDAFFERLPGHRLHNLYGPTEASVDVTAWRCQPGADPRTVPIGRPVANTQIHVLDANGRLVPVGVPGELHIGGVQVATGYLNRPELTAQRFVPNPFGPGLLYRTGDVARRRADGVVEFLGRSDHQVKVRGYRIEPGEIESALREHPAVKQAVVVAHGKDGQLRLVGYVVPAGGEVVLAELRAYLAERLPAYLVPSVLTVLDALPLLPNGKLDSAALPEPGAAAQGSPSVPPSTPDEYLLHQVWREVLGRGDFGANESFFALGGDSMLAIRTRTALERGHDRTFTVAELFEGPTIRELATRLRPTDLGADTAPRTAPFELLSTADRALLPDGLDDAYPLSSMQAGMLYHVAYQEESSVYRVVTSVRVASALDIDALRAACAGTASRHPALRSSFDLARFSEPLQLVHTTVTVPVEVAADLSGLGEAERASAVEEFVEQAKFTRFDPAAPPLFRFVVHPRGPREFQLTVVEHHVVLDGWSDLLLLEEVLDRYLAELAGEPVNLPEVASTYRDFVAAERTALAEPAAREFWAETLRGAVPTRLFGRSARGDESGPSVSRARRFEVPVPAALDRRLRALAREEGLSLKAVLVAAHLMVLRTAGGQDEVLTGLVANARLEEAGGEDVIGVFLNTLPLRVDVAGSTPALLARRVFEYEQHVAPYRRYPFGQIQRDLGEQNALDGLDSYVNFMDFHRGRYRTGNSVLGESVAVADTNYPLAVDFLVEPEHGRLVAWLDCNVSVLPAQYCQRLAGYYRRALEAVADGPHRPVAEADLLADAEHAELAGWNATEIEYDTTDTVPGLIARQAQRTPAATALAYQWDELDYAALDARANQLAHRLVAAGVRRGDRVGISVRRGLDLVVGLLSILKTGAAYVPMDPAFPGARLAMIARDAGISCLVAATDTPDVAVPTVVDLHAEADVIAAQPTTPVDVEVTGSDVAYVMYTSGSTGTPKGAIITHRNVVNFCLGMDRRVGCGPEDVLLAVTSVSFDISVLELLWPLTHGAKVVVAGERIIQNLSGSGDAVDAVGFSLFFAGAAQQDAGEAYRLVLDAARFADTHGFHAAWTLARHFPELGGQQANPSVMSTVLATSTDRIALRCGSVVGPSHDVVPMAAEWSLVDSLSGGRVGLAFAPQHDDDLADQLDRFRGLWRGESVPRVDESGEQGTVRMSSAPVQAQPPIWLTSVGSSQTFRQAGASGVNLLTHLLGQSTEALAEKIAAYRKGRAEAGHTGPGQVTVMVPTFLSADPEQARRDAREPFRAYLRNSTQLWPTLFATTGQEFPEQDAESAVDTVDAVIEQAIDHYFETAGLFGSPESCAPLVSMLGEAGVDEIACLVDFGPGTDAVLDSLAWVDRLRRDHEAGVAQRPHSFAQLCRRHGVTLTQGTPSLLSAVAAEPEALASLSDARALLVGGEAFPSGLAERLLDGLPGVRVLNMYGPTETTIWSTVHELDRVADVGAGMIPIGTPIANTTVSVVDAHGRVLPVGVAGELWIGGDGVASGYLDRPELTEDRFVTTPAGERCYRTGDRVRWRPDGTLEFLGRVDRQVKIHGHRVEPDEVESVLSRHPELDAVAVVAVPGDTGVELVAYVSPTDVHADPEAHQAHVRRWTEVWQEAYQPDAEERARSEFAGWASSYTGEPIPPEQMSEWLGHTVERIRALKPTDMADIGVGVGLVLRGFAAHTNSYHGIDISAAALASAERCLGPDRPLPGHVTLTQSGPEYLATLPEDSLDTVVLNSVVQYFPSTDYLREVLTDAVRAVRPAGAVYVGDVRSLEMLPEFHTSVQLHRAPELHPLEEVRTTVARQVREEPELCLSPAFFQRLAADLPEVGEVRIELKRGRSDNELSLFRYDVTILVGPRPAPPPTTRLDWAALADGLTDVQQALVSTSDSVLVSGVPNRRLVLAVAAVEAVAAMPGEATVWDLDRELWSVDDTAAVHPEELIDLAASAGREARLLVPADGRFDVIDVLFERYEEQEGLR